MVPGGDDIEVPGMSDDQVDDLVDRVDGDPDRGPSQEREEPTTPEPEQYKFTHNGKEVSATREQLIKWAQQGYDYPQKMQRLNQERQQWEAQRTAENARWEEHRKIEAWAQANPDKWAAVTRAFQNQGQSPTQAAASAQALDANQIRQIIQAELTKNPLVSEVLTEHQQAKVKAEDSALDTAINEIRSKYKDIDFDAVNDQGLSLEKQILDHAIKNGIKSFNTAFRDYCYEQLEARAIANAKASVTRTTQANTKIGILGKSPSPKSASRFSAPQNVRSQSYEELEREALEELRASQSH